MKAELHQVAVRPSGLGYELFHTYFNLTCNANSFLGHYDLWPFCKPYDLEPWWDFLDDQEAQLAAGELTDYLLSIPERISPPRISFVRVAQSFQLRSNGHVCGMYLFRGEDTNNIWPFHRLKNWNTHSKEIDAMRAMLRLQAYLDGRGEKRAKEKKATKAKKK